MPLKVFLAIRNMFNDTQALEIKNGNSIKCLFINNVNTK